ncbi:MAG: MaoC family dehydratase N-terminal domain-containing protein [Deltaproteobacteria bacterium]|nr:MaoC family dehydratase N-terminal domain-containing protein [Deltaproteobacteria bacterium]
MADASKKGTKYNFEWLVERGKIRELVQAIGDQNPIYNELDAALAEGYDDVVASPTFTTVPLMWTGVLFQAFADLKMNHARCMHAEQSYEYFTQIHPGDVLSGLMEVKSIIHREGKSGPLDFVLFEMTYTNQRQETVLREEMLVVERL